MNPVLYWHFSNNNNCFDSNIDFYTHWFMDIGLYRRC